MRFPLYFCLLFLLPISLFAQQPDSLRALLTTPLPDSTRAKVLNDLAGAIHYYAAEETLALTAEAIEISQRSGFLLEEIRAYYHELQARYILDQMSAAIEAGQKGLKKAQALGDQRWQYRLLNSLHHTFEEIKDYDKTLSALNQMQIIAQALEDPRLISDTKVFLGNFYIKQNRKDLARPPLEEAIFELKAQNDTLGMANIYSLLFLAVEDGQDRKKLILKATSLAEKSPKLFDKISIFHVYGNYLLREENNYPAAIEQYRKSFELAYRLGEPMYSTQTCYGLGTSFLALGQPDSAWKYYQIAFNIPDDLAPLTWKKEMMLDWSNHHKANGRLDSAYHYLQKALTVSDSLQSQKQREELTDAKARYDLAQKDAEILSSQLELANQVNIRQRLVGGGAILLGMLFGGFQWVSLRQRRKAKAIALALEREKVAAQQLRELDELKGQFFTNVSHELRTPLTLIISPLEESLKALKQVGLRAKLTTALRNSQRLLGLTNEILDLAKLEAGKLSLQWSYFSLEKQLRVICAAFQSEAEAKNLDFQLQIDLPHQKEIYSAQKQFTTILTNLLANAVKFTPADGKITVSAKHNHQSFQIMIADSGPGIPEEDLPRIFDRFYQSKHTARNLGGTGIGLSLSQQLAHLLRGELTAESSPQQGSTFTLTLPLQPSPAGAPHQPSESESESPAVEASYKTLPPPTPSWSPVGPLPRLLIVEDNPDMASYLQEQFQQEYECFMARNGQEALELLEETPVDLITSDVMMPTMDGFELRRRINEEARLHDIPFLLLTARALEKDKLRGFQLGVDDYVTKPFSLPELRARMQCLLKNKQHRESEWGDVPPEQDASLVTKASEYIDQRMEDTSWGIEDLARDLGYSQRHLARVIGPLTGLSPVQLVLEIRLQRAYQLLSQGQYAGVNEVRFAVGIESASYFSRKFKARFGISPTALMARSNSH